MRAETHIPKHIGIIMDGNGRWATARGLKRSAGHKEGMEAAKRIVSTASRLGVEWLSLYTFSTENWKRTADEVGCLMDLLAKNLRSQMDFYIKRQIRLVHSGDISGLPDAVQKEILDVTRLTSSFTGLTVNLAINYGGRDEIIRGMKKAMRDLASQGLSSQDLDSALAGMDESAFASALDVPCMPDVDLLIRTGGEQRLSNFLLWKSAYAELVFSPRYWPDWDSLDFEAAIEEFSRRNRRFGAVTAHPDTTSPVLPGTELEVAVQSSLRQLPAGRPELLVRA